VFMDYVYEEGDEIELELITPSGRVKRGPYTLPPRSGRLNFSTGGSLCE